MTSPAAPDAMTVKVGYMLTTTSGSSPTTPEPDGRTTAATIRLGRILAEGLEETDTAGRWMAHHLADLLDRAEGAGSTPKDVRRVEKLVIKL